MTKLTWYKKMLIETRWGNQITDQDRFLASEMTFLEIWKSSFLLPKTLRYKTSSLIRRR